MVAMSDDDRTGWMTAHDAELLRILTRDTREEQRHRDAERIRAEEREALRRLTSRVDGESGSR